MTVEGNLEPPHPARRRPLLRAALLLGVLSVVFAQWILMPVKIDGESMTPNYQSGQPNYINKLAYFSRPPQRGDVVGVRVGREGIYLKRIIGLPGERIEFHRGTVMVNGKPLAEPYVEKSLLWVLPPVQVSAHDYFVMGDNRQVSLLGTVPQESIIGKVVF